MRYCDWDEVLDRDGLLILTEEALTPPRRSRAPLRRLAAAAACAGLVLGLMNYRAVAAGVGELCRYFAGIGATADDKAELWVLEGLSREERRLFTLRFVYGLSSAELGGVLGLSPNGVDARVSRLRKKLKRLLARQGLGLWEREGTK